MALQRYIQKVSSVTDSAPQLSQDVNWMQAFCVIKLCAFISVARCSVFEVTEYFLMQLYFLQYSSVSGCNAVFFLNSTISVM